MQQHLSDFIEHARKKGMDHATIRILLISAGWKEKDIAEAMTKEALDMAVPMPPDTGGARDAFFHLLNFAALYTWVIASIMLCFTYIERLLPDATQMFVDYSNVSSSIRWSLAPVIVAYPLFLWMSRILIREMQLHTEKAASGIRRWLTYLTLFIAAATLMGDLITLVGYLLNGELSIRFILKVIVILLTTGAVFSYYFISLRSTPAEAKKSKLNVNYGYASLAFVAFIIVYGIVIAGTPFTARAEQFDEKRLSDFRVITSEISNFVYEARKGSPDAQIVNPIPKSLADLASAATYQKVNVIDSESGSPYEYSVTDATHYRLCATFNAVRDQAYDIFWNHPVGRHCFDIDVTSNVP